MSTLRNILASNVKNIIGGTRVPEKMIILESDDWGSNRIASRDDFKNLVKAGILNDKSSTYDRCDTIARTEDLEILFDILSSVKDKNGNSAIITPFFNVVNPDFDKIRESDYQVYHYETFIQTLEKIGEENGVLKLWKEGIAKGLVIPAYHGREHLCVPLWMKYLRNDDKRVKEAFLHHFYAVPKVLGLTNMAGAFRPSLYFDNEAQMKFNGAALVDGIRLVTEILETKISVFAPPNGISHLYFDKLLSENGIKLIHNTRRYEPDGKGSGVLAKRKANEYNQKYYNRTCAFEPSYSNNALDICLHQIQGAFNWHKPAIISTHRVNYMGYISPSNRDKGISQLQQLLKAIVKKWPDVVFASSNDYANILLNK